MDRRHVVDGPNPLNPNIWKHESNGPKFRAFTEHRYIVISEQRAKRESSTLHADFNLSVISGSMPWILMGEVLGQLYWSGSGAKVQDVQNIPARILTRIKSKFPENSIVPLARENHMIFLEWHKLNLPPLKLV